MVPGSLSLRPCLSQKLCRAQQGKDKRNRLLNSLPQRGRVGGDGKPLLPLFSFPELPLRHLTLGVFLRRAQYSPAIRGGERKLRSAWMHLSSAKLPQVLRRSLSLLVFLLTSAPKFCWRFHCRRDAPASGFCRAPPALDGGLASETVAYLHPVKCRDEPFVLISRDVRLMSRPPAILVLPVGDMIVRRVLYGHTVWQPKHTAKPCSQHQRIWNAFLDIR